MIGPESGIERQDLLALSLGEGVFPIVRRGRFDEGRDGNVPAGGIGIDALIAHWALTAAGQFDIRSVDLVVDSASSRTARVRPSQKVRCPGPPTVLRRDRSGSRSALGTRPDLRVDIGIRTACDRAFEACSFERPVAGRPVGATEARRRREQENCPRRMRDPFTFWTSPGFPRRWARNPCLAQAIRQLPST